MKITVLARAYQNQPLRRVAVDANSKLIYLSHPDKLTLVESGESSAVGFPREDVFVFDAAEYERLRRVWERDGDVDWSTARLREFKPPGMFYSLTPRQQANALTYRGPEAMGDDAFKLR